MTVKIRAALDQPFHRWRGDVESGMEVAVQGGVEAATLGLKLDLRRVIARALTQRIGNAIGSTVYPKGRKSLGAAGFVYARGRAAERVLSAFAEGAVIRPSGASGFGQGKMLAIPTQFTPRSVNAGRGGRGGSRPMTPAEVEAHFNADLIPIPLKGRGRAPLMLAIEVVAARASNRRFRRATRRRLQAGRTKELVPMFILVPYVRLEKRFDANALAVKWLNQVPQLIERAIPPDA